MFVKFNKKHNETNRQQRKFNLKGKTISKIFFKDMICCIHFTDETFCMIEKYEDHENIDFLHLSSDINLFNFANRDLLLDFELINNDEFAKLDKQALCAFKEREKEILRQLQKKYQITA